MARNPTIEVKFTGDTSGLEKATGRVDAEISGVGGKISGFAVGAGAALTSFGIQAIPQLVDFGTELFNLGQASEIGLQKSRTVFGDSAGDIASWADDVNESLGLSDEAVIGLAASMGDLLVPLGFTRDAAADMSMQTTELSGALSAWSQGKYDAAAVSEILTKAMLGERDGLKALGISISQAEVDEKALAIARADGRDEITAQDKALATQQLILEKSTDAQAAWADGTMDAVKSQNELSATIADAKEGLAKGLVPIVQNVVRWITTSLIPGVRNLVQTFKVYWPQIKETVQPIMESIVGIVQAVIEILQVAWDLFGSTIIRYTEIAFGYIRETIQNVMQVIQGILDVVLGILTGDWSRAWDGIKAIVDGVWDQITNLVRTAARLLGMILDLAWEGLKRAARAAWDGIKSAVSGAIEGIIQFHRELPGRLVTAIGDLAGLLVGAGKSLISGLKSGAIDVFASAIEWAKGLPERIKSAVGDLGRLLWNVGASILQGLWDGMKSKWNSMTGWIGGLAGKIKNLKGPPAYDAVVLAGNGGLLIQGLLDGMKAEWPQVEKFAASLAPQLSSSLSLSSARIPARSAGSSSSTTIIQNLPAGLSPTRVTEASRQYVRTQGPM